MALSETWESKSADSQEEWFLQALDADPMQTDDMLALLRMLADKGDAEKANEWSEMLQDVLVEAKDETALRGLLTVRAGWQPDTAFAKTCYTLLKQATEDRVQLVFLKHVGFEEGVPASECLRRLDVLTALQPGVICLDKTWGFGVMKQVDDFYAKVTIDFDNKPRHQMSFAYAAEALTMIDDDHLLARRHRDPEALAGMIKTDPAEVVRVTLRSYGGLTAPQLKDTLVPAILPESDWKRFWDAARKVLKADPLVEIPTKRSESIVLRESEKQYGAAWRQRLAAMRDPDNILETIEEWEAAQAVSAADQDTQDAILDRLAFAAHAADGKDAAMTARIAMFLDRTAWSSEALSADTLAARCLDEAAFDQALTSLPARALRAFLAFLKAREPARTAQALLTGLNTFSFSVVGEAISYLDDDEETRGALETTLREQMAQMSAGVPLILWLCRNMDWVAKREITTLGRLAQVAVDALEKTCAGETLRAQNQLRTTAAQAAWWKKVLATLSDEEVTAIILRINQSRGWESTDQRSVLARIIKLRPTMANVLSSRSSKEPEPQTVRMTSWRSLRARQAEFKKLCEVDIPANARDIARARSYGDLRENAEYKAAKEHQGILQRRQMEMDADLKAVRGTDFEHVSLDGVGMGTCVTLVTPSGNQETYCVLGEWDRDEALNIISNKSRLAQVLAGHKKGDRLTLPGRDDGGECDIVEISPLGAEIRSWLAAT